MVLLFCRLWLPGKVAHTDQGMPQPGVHPGMLEQQGVRGSPSAQLL